MRDVSFGPPVRLKPDATCKIGAAWISSRRTYEIRTAVDAGFGSRLGICSGAGEYRGPVAENRSGRRPVVYGEVVSPADADERLQHVLAARCALADVHGAAVSRRHD